MIRSELRDLIEIGAFPASQGADLPSIKRRQELLDRIKPPVSDSEARELVKLFGPDEYFGLAWTVLHLIEGAPGWPLADCLSVGPNAWIDRLKRRRTGKADGK
jgi:hypothetical protein